MRVLVTGATGFIGQHLVLRLADDGNEIISCSRAASGPPGAKHHVQHDFRESAPLPEVGPLDAIIHLAAASSVVDAQEDPAGVTQVNVQGTLAALLLAREQGARFVLASSQRVYRMGPLPLQEEAARNPVDLYGFTKLAAELYVAMVARVHGVPSAIVRPFSVYGPGQVITRGISGVVSILAQRALSGGEMRVLSRYPKDFVDVTDVADGIARALAACQSPPRAYNVATGAPTTVLALAQMLRDIAGSASPIVEDYTHDEPGGLVANIDRARRELGYEPQVGLEEGLRRYVTWLSNHSAPDRS